MASPPVVEGVLQLGFRFEPTESSAAPAADQEDDDHFALTLEGSSEQAPEAEEAEAFEAEDWFAPMMARACKERDPFAAAMARQGNLMTPIF